jgi:uncharacterized protein
MRAIKACLLALLLCWSAVALADVAVPVLTGRVVDQTATLSQADQATLDTTLRDFQKRKGSQVVVLIVPTTSPENIAQYSIRVAEAWKIGRKKVDDGVILLVAKNDRKLRIEVGYGLEGALTDATTNRIIDEIIAPRFKAGDFAGGIAAGVDQTIKVIDGEQLPAPAEWRGNSDVFEQLFEYAPFLLFGVLIFGSILRNIFGRLFGSLATGGIVTTVVWLVAGSLLFGGILGAVAFFFTLISEALMSGGGGGGRRGGGYVGGSGGSWSSGSSSSSSSSGGFSGGGGSFGGGGASGSW